MWVSLKAAKTIHVDFCTIFEFEGPKVKRITAFSAVA